MVTLLHEEQEIGMVAGSVSATLTRVDSGFHSVGGFENGAV